jgi:hypothetical protein
MDDVDTRAEAELLEAARRGDPAAFERLVGRYQGELYAHCYRPLAATSFIAPFEAGGPAVLHLRTAAPAGRSR